jgi:hypothetical protein
VLQLELLTQHIPVSWQGRISSAAAGCGIAMIDAAPMMMAMAESLDLVDNMENPL